MKRFDIFTIRFWRMALILGIILAAALPAIAFAKTEEPAIRVVMFWMESCGHCHYVLDEVLPPLQSKYGEQLKIHLIEAISTEDFDRLYQIAALLGVAKNDVAVPFLVIGNRVLIGSDQIPAELPGLIDHFLAQGGVDIPDSLHNLLPTLTPEKVFVYLFWGDGCPHCEQAKPALEALAQRNPNVEVREYEVWYQAENQAILIQMAAKFGFESRYVPTIFIGERFWEGYSDNIQMEIESTVAACLEAGCSDAGLGFVPADSSEIASLPGASETVSSEVTAQVQSNGFVLAIVVILIMVASLIYSGLYLTQGVRQKQIIRGRIHRRQKPALSVSLDVWRNKGFLALCLLGLVVAGYLAYVETQAVPAVCGPVGDCNAVQSSSYARLFGFLPVGVLGAFAYLAILAIWLYPRLGHHRAAIYSPILVFGMLFFGVLFSLYLTFLEIFVIKAVCMWCITSAVIMTTLLLLSLKPARQNSQVLQKVNR